MADTEKDVQGVAELLAKTTVDQVNIVSFKGKGLKLNSSEDGEIFLAVNLLKKTMPNVGILCTPGRKHVGLSVLCFCIFQLWRLSMQLRLAKTSKRCAWKVTQLEWKLPKRLEKHYQQGKNLR